MAVTIEGNYQDRYQRKDDYSFKTPVCYENISTTTRAQRIRDRFNKT